jgi:hypothetical protein
MLATYHQRKPGSTTQPSVVSPLAEWILLRGCAADDGRQVMHACQTCPVSDQGSPAICSAKGCQAAATWAVVWNNPRLHTPDREKVWVACDEHQQPLADYLAVRSFLKRVEPLEADF